MNMSQPESHKNGRPHFENGRTTKIFLAGVCSFDVPSRFVWYNLYVYYVQLTLAGWMLVRFLKWNELNKGTRAILWLMLHKKTQVTNAEGRKLSSKTTLKSSINLHYSGLWRTTLEIKKILLGVMSPNPIVVIVTKQK